MFLKPLFPIATTGRHFFLSLPIIGRWQDDYVSILSNVWNSMSCQQKRRKKTRPLCLPPHLTGYIKSFSQYTLCHEKSPFNLFCFLLQINFFLRKNVHINNYFTIIWQGVSNQDTLLTKTCSSLQLYCIYLFQKNNTAPSDLQLPLQQWGTGNVYLLVLSSWKVNIAENPNAVMRL